MNTYTDRGDAEVSIGVLMSTSHHIQCINSQQLRYYIILQKAINNKNETLAMDYA